MTNAALRVPRNDIETVRNLDARWDAIERQWFVPPGRDSTPFAMWLPAEVPESDPRIPVTVVLLPDRCYRCGRFSAPVVGIWFERGLLNGYEYGMLEESGGWLLLYDDFSADVIATACPDDLLAEHGAGRLRWCTTKMCPDGYLANTCHHCDAVFGNSLLYESFVEYQADSGDVRALPSFGSEVVATMLEKLD